MAWAGARAHQIPGRPRTRHRWRLTPADAFVVVTPIYNRSYPGSLKNAIDWFYTAWQLKSVGFISYGGITGGLQSIDAPRLEPYRQHLRIGLTDRADRYALGTRGSNA